MWLTWLEREKIREGASLNMLLVGGCLKHRNCKMIQFSFLGKQGEQSADLLLWIFKGQILAYLGTHLTATLEIKF